MRRNLLPLLCVVPLLIAPSAAPGASYKVGISDQNAATFVDPLFAPLKFQLARYVVPWDALNAGRIAYANNLTNWVNHARQTHQRILLAFETSHVKGHERRAPTVAQYTKALKKFKAAYPDIHDIQAWNEVNRCSDVNEVGYVVGQPICKKPKLAAQYYMAARKVFKGAKITGLDILDARDIHCRQMYCALRYLKTFLKYAKPRPKFWGLHNYADTNRFSMERTKAILKVTKSGDVWLTETGGIVSLGGGFPYNQKRAAKALGCMFTLAKSNRRITRLYVYNYRGNKKSKLFDAGLVNPNGSKRPGYEVVRKRKAGRCRSK